MMSFRQHARIVNVLEDRNINLRVGLQNRVPWVKKEAKRSKGENRERGGPPATSFCRCLL